MKEKLIFHSNGQWDLIKKDTTLGGYFDRIAKLKQESGKKDYTIEKQKILNTEDKANLGGISRKNAELKTAVSSYLNPTLDLQPKNTKK